MGLIRALWGVGGVLLLSGYAVLKLTPPALDTFSQELAWYHWGILVLNTPFVAYFKGYRGFQRGFAPRVAARAKYLASNGGNVWWTIFAPLFCMGYFHILKRKKIVTYGMTVGMVGLIVLVRFLPPPWRGIIDLGILVGLAWGFVAVLGYSIRAFSAPVFAHSPQIPAEATP